MDLVGLFLSMRWIATVLAVLLVFHLIGVWMERRGWIYYRKPGRRHGYGMALSNAMAEFDAVLNPASEHRVIEERHQDAMRYVVEISELEDDGPEPGEFPGPVT
ncbi:MAG: hypothetical protein WD473_03295 [Acidimicrobiia bacterium]